MGILQTDDNRYSACLYFSDSKIGQIFESQLLENPKRRIVSK
jgi:hypothetical protein